MERVQSEYYKTMTMPKPIVRTVYFPNLSPELQGELWVYNTIYDLGIGYALCIDSCPEHRPVVAIVSMTTGEQLIRERNSNGNIAE